MQNNVVKSGISIPTPGVPALEAYANNTASTLLYLLLDLSEVRNTEADHAAAHLAGLCTRSIQLDP